MSRKTFDMFLSYKSEDFPWVKRLKDNLQQRGVRVWLDKDEIRPGDLFAQALENGLETSRAVGLVVTPNSLESGWVREEYYRAISLTKEAGLQLIPLLLREATLPGFLAGRQFVDFRDEELYEQNVDKVVWPGITSKRIIFSGIHYVGGFPWGKLGDDIKKLGLELHGADYPEFAPDEINDLVNRGYRVVAVVDVFEDWPWNRMQGRPAQLYVDIIFNIREQTRGTRSEVVFVLYQHPDAFSQAPHNLDANTVKRLKHYFTISKTFWDRSWIDPSEEPSPDKLLALESSLRDTWYKIQREMLRTENSK